MGYQKRRNKHSHRNPDWNDTITFEYICTGYNYSGICSQRVMSATKLEGMVIDHIKNLYSHPKVQEKIKNLLRTQLEMSHDEEVKNVIKKIT